jgi:hypothetical protein
LTRRLEVSPDRVAARARAATRRGVDGFGLVSTILVEML